MGVQRPKNIEKDDGTSRLTKSISNVGVSTGLIFSSPEWTKSLIENPFVF